MTKIINKLLYILKNILFPITFIATIYIIIFMFKRLEKDIFGASLIEFIQIVLPFILLLILNLITIFLNTKEVKNNIFYNITSFLVMLVISVFCYRALMDKNMFLWYKYGYNINFNYFAYHTKKSWKLGIIFIFVLKLRVNYYLCIVINFQLTL